MRYSTIRDIISAAADLAGVANTDAGLGGREMKSYMIALRQILARYRARGILFTALASYKFPFPAAAGVGNVLKFYEYNEALTSQLVDGTPAKAAYDSGLPVSAFEFGLAPSDAVWLPHMILEPASVSLGLPSNGTVVNIQRIDIYQMMEGMQTIYNDNAFPWAWSWNPGANELWLRGKTISPQSVVVNAQYANDMDFDWNDSVASFPTGLPEVLVESLAYKITVLNGMPDAELNRSAADMLDAYVKANTSRPSYRVDPSAPGVRHSAWSPTCKPWR
jgi:hypothetical protein